LDCTIRITERIGIEADKDPFSREAHVDIVVAQCLSLWIVAPVLVLVRLDGQHGISDQSIVVDPATERAVAVRRQERFVVDKALEMIVNVLADCDLFALGADPGGQRIIGEEMLEAPGAVIAVLGVGAHRAHGLSIFAGFVREIQHAIFLVPRAVDGTNLILEIVTRLASAALFKTMDVFHIDHAIGLVPDAIGASFLAGQVEDREDRAIFVPARLQDIHHALGTMFGAETSLVFVRKIEHGPQTALRMFTFLVDDIDHVVGPVRTTEPSLLLVG